MSQSRAISAVGMTYTPHPGSVPDRAFAYLLIEAPAGGSAWVTSAALASAIDCPQRALSATMATAISHGLVLCNKGAAGGMSLWQAGRATGDGEAPLAFNFRPGSAGDKAVRALHAHGQRMSDMALTVAVDVELAELLPFLAYPLKMGALKREVDPKDGLGWWTLGDGTPVEPAPPAAAAPAEPPTAAWPPTRAGEPPRRTRRRRRNRARRKPCASPPGNSGELEIQRADGSEVIFSPDEFRQIVAYLDSIALDSVREAA